MDRTLDEILDEKKPSQRSGGGNNNRRAGGGSNGRGRRERNDNYPRDGIRKSYRDREEPRNLDKDWVHDKFEDHASRNRNSNRRRQQEPPENQLEQRGTKIRVENVHYELTESDLDELFNRIGPVLKLNLQYDRAGRSEGIAYVVYENRDDAKEAVKQFDGANANGQPIRLTILPSGPRGQTQGQRNPFDTARMPPRPLEERITKPVDDRARSVSPDQSIDKAAAIGIDRYVPGGHRSHSPVSAPAQPRRREGQGRRPGARRDGGMSGRGSDRGNGSGREGGGGRRTGGDGRNNRPRKTAEELDADMADYFGGGEAKGTDSPATEGMGAGVANGNVDDIDMIG